jgi:DNA-directed RNA polymerase specialized sigma24 family protein
MTPAASNVTELLAAWRVGDRAALEKLVGRLTVEETATVVGISPATVKREWSRARAWLSRDLASSREV